MKDTVASSIFTKSSPPKSSSLAAVPGEAALPSAKPTRKSCRVELGSIMEARRRVLESRPLPPSCMTQRFVVYN